MNAATWEGLNPPYRTIVADPPWRYDDGWPKYGSKGGEARVRIPLPYSGMDLSEIQSLPVRELADADSHLYLWTTNRYLDAAFDVCRHWGFRPAQTLVWCKAPRGLGPGGAFSITTEFVIFGRRGSLAATERVDTSWWEWNRSRHSVKPAAFYDVVEQVSPGPRVELFARQPRLGWEAWGYGHEAAPSRRSVGA